VNLQDQADQDAALRVPCPEPPFGCGAPVAQLCTRPDGLGGRTYLDHAPAHIHRLHAAGVSHDPLPPRAVHPHERTPAR
jgi:hypothetical protein